MIRREYSGFIAMIAAGANTTVRGLTGFDGEPVRLSLSYWASSPIASGTGVSAQRIAVRRLPTDRLSTEVPAEKAIVVTALAQNDAKNAGVQAYGEIHMLGAEDVVIANETSVAIYDIRWAVVLDTQLTTEVTEPPHHCSRSDS